MTSTKQENDPRNEGAKRPPGERWAADEWGDDPFWPEETKSKDKSRAD
jgi:hypothetical protein